MLLLCCVSCEYYIMLTYKTVNLSQQIQDILILAITRHSFNSSAVFQNKISIGFDL